MKLEEIIKFIEYKSFSGRCDQEVVGITCDSRRVRPGYIFIAINGHKFDGKSFIEDAIGKGAVGVVSEQEDRVRADICHIRVADARCSMADLACAFYGRPSEKLQVVGITGTNGKTTISYIIRDMLNTAGRTPGLLGTVEYKIGARTIPAVQTTPNAPELQMMLSQMVGAGCRSVVMEVSSHALEQERTRGIDFDVAVFSNLTRDHLDYHKTPDAYFDAKSRLFRNLGLGCKKALAVINVDDPRGKQLIEISAEHADVLSYGMNTEADVRADNIEVSSAGSSFHVYSPWGMSEVRMNMMGRFNVSNALAAITACGWLGLSMNVMVDSLLELSGIPGRLEEIETKKGFQVFIDYAHTDDALGHVLRTLGEIVHNRLIVVFGCGGNRDTTKRAVMGEIAGTLATHTIVTSDNPRKEEPGAIISQICSGFREGDSFEVMENREDAIRRGLKMAQKGDIVLIAGKGHERFQELVNTTVPFDDRQVVKNIISEM